MSDYLNALFGLQGKVAVVIGGTGVLCGQMAQGLAEAGAQVMLAGRSQEKADARIALIEQAGGRACFTRCDVSDVQQIQRLLEQTIEVLGQVDVLINGAGVNSATPILDIEAEEFDRIVNSNLKAVLQASQVFARYWLAHDQAGSIINVGSVSGLRPLSRVFTYSASKAAVHNLSANMARDWAEQKIRVNTLIPGFFPAEQNRKVLTPERVSQIMMHTPMNRFGEPQELLGATILLASDAGSFITGTEVVVDGGFSGVTI